MTEKNQKYNIPLRKELMKVPRYLRAKKAIKSIKKYLNKHLKTDVQIGPALNEKIWENGPRNPPTKVEVVIHEQKKDDQIFLEAELFGAKKRERIKKSVVNKRQKLADRLKASLMKEKTEEKKEKEEPKKEEKTEEDKLQEEIVKKGEDLKKTTKPETKEKKKPVTKEQNEKAREETLIKRTSKNKPIKK